MTALMLNVVLLAMGRVRLETAHTARRNSARMATRPKPPQSRIPCHDMETSVALKLDPGKNLTRERASPRESWLTKRSGRILSWLAVVDAAHYS